MSILQKYQEKVYQFKVHLIGVSPMVWRRILVKETTSIAQLHGILQIVMGWENRHLHCFEIYGKKYGISYIGGMGFLDDPKKVCLSDFQLRIRDKFFYSYDFNVNWKHQIRLEKVVELVDNKNYPVCVNGKNACPPENTLGINHFSKIRDLYKMPFYDLLKIIKFQDDLGYAWRPDIFKIKIINSLLQQNDYDFMVQNNPYFPERSSPYFEDTYWYKKDDLQGLKKMYHILKHNGIDVKDESDGFIGEATGWKVFQVMLEKLSKQMKPEEAVNKKSRY